VRKGQRLPTTTGGGKEKNLDSKEARRKTTEKGFSRRKNIGKRKEPKKNTEVKEAVRETRNAQDTLNDSGKIRLKHSGWKEVGFTKMRYKGGKSNWEKNENTGQLTVKRCSQVWTNCFETKGRGKTTAKCFF